MTIKLRFTEFEHSGEWEEKELESVAIFLKGKGISKSDVSGNGTHPCIRYGELYTHYKEIIKSVVSFTNLPQEDLILSEPNDVIIPSSGETREDIATASCVVQQGIALGGDLNILRSEVNGVFLAYYLTHAKKKEIAKLAQGDAVVHLYASQLKKLVVNFPKLRAEQQKIADCLSSLDELVTAENQTLEALQLHKKGLMQQLFPAESEKVPTLRFKEFMESGDWEPRELGEFINERNQIATDKLPLYSLTIEGGVVPKTERYERSFLVKDEANAYKIVLNNDFAFNPMNLRFGAIAKYSGMGKAALSKYYNIFYCDNTVDPEFCSIYFRSSSMIAHYDDIAIGSLIEKRRVHFSSFLKLKIRFPRLLEQQKIANCLSSLDDAIIAQTQKVKALKTHKSGLMQQLFPNVNKYE